MATRHDEAEVLAASLASVVTNLGGAQRAGAVEIYGEPASVAGVLSLERAQ